MRSTVLFHFKTQNNHQTGRGTQTRVCAGGAKSEKMATPTITKIVELKEGGNNAGGDMIWGGERRHWVLLEGKLWLRSGA